jgi:hypothetical protein
MELFQSKLKITEILNVLYVGYFIFPSGGAQVAHCQHYNSGITAYYTELPLPHLISIHIF